MQIEEVTLTGVSVGVGKHAATLDQPSLALGDRRNMAYAGTVAVVPEALPAGSDDLTGDWRAAYGVTARPDAAPSANAICECFAGSLRRECLDHILVIGVLELSRILKEYATDFDQARPHTCTCARVQVSRDHATDTGANSVIALGAEGRKGDCVMPDRHVSAYVRCVSTPSRTA